MLTAEEIPAGLILEATRESALKIILDQLAPNDAVVSTTGALTSTANIQTIYANINHTNPAQDFLRCVVCRIGPGSSSLRKKPFIKQMLRLKGMCMHCTLRSKIGMASREVFELREQQGEDHSRDFLTVGGMGHCSSIALGIAMAKSSKRVICIDGDGAVIMHMGAMHTIGSRGQPNFYQIVLNNGAHDSVGGQPTGALSMDLPGVAIAVGICSLLLILLCQFSACCGSTLQACRHEKPLTETMSD